jgi:hypothetical protein
MPSSPFLLERIRVIVLQMPSDFAASSGLLIP